MAHPVGPIAHPFHGISWHLMARWTTHDTILSLPLSALPGFKRVHVYASSSQFSRVLTLLAMLCSTTAYTSRSYSITALL